MLNIVAVFFRLAGELAGSAELESLKSALVEGQRLGDDLAIKVRESEAKTKSQQQEEEFSFQGTDVPLQVAQEAR